jgi:hypothetical protein
VDGLPTRFVNVASARQKYGDRVDRLGRYLTRVDTKADAAVAAIEELPKGEGWRLFEQGIRRGARAIPHAPLAMRELLEEVEAVPAWVDWETCDRGGAMLMRAGILGGAVLGARSLPLGYASPGGNKPLVFSGRMKEQAARRVNETARFVQAVSRPGGMRPFADGWQITVKVRLMHAKVRRMILRSGRWDAERWGAPINQHDMAGTTLLFSVSIIDGLRQLGMRISRDEAERYVHLWRWTGRVIGVDEGVLPASEAEAMRIAEVIAATMGEPDDDSRELTTALFAGAYDGATTRAQVRAADRHVMFGASVCRELIGDELADKLGVRRSHLRYAMPIIKRLVRSAERFTLAVPYGEQAAVAAGTRYWDKVVEVGLRGVAADFGLPQRLGRAAA